MKMYKILLYSMFTCVLKSETSTISERSEQRDDFKHYPEVGWVHHHPIPVEWAEARIRCYYEGAELMSPVDKNMLNVMSDIGGTTAIWTGVHATYSKADYFSIKGVPLSDMPITWAQGEPNNENNNEECLIMLSGGNIADCSCNDTYAFSCYKPNNFRTPHCGSVSGYELDHRTNNCYKFHNIAQNWSRAFMICAAEGAHLAVIDTIGEQQVLQDLFSKYPANVIRGESSYDSKNFVHLGYRDWEGHMLWMTINGKNLDYLINERITAWAKGEPNNLGQKEYCGSMTRHGTLNDASCNYKLPFICEFENKSI